MNAEIDQFEKDNQQTIALERRYAAVVVRCMCALGVSSDW